MAERASSLARARSSAAESPLPAGGTPAISAAAGWTTTAPLSGADNATGALASSAEMISNYSPFAAMAFIRATSALAPPFCSTVPKSDRRVAIWLIAFL